MEVSIEPDEEMTEDMDEPEPEEEVCYVCGGAAGLDHEPQFCPMLSEERDLMDVLNMYGEVVWPRDEE